jgi:hypothetical protein
MTEIDQIWGQNASRRADLAGLKFLHVELVLLKARQLATRKATRSLFHRASEAAASRLKRLKPRNLQDRQNESAKVRKSLHFLLYTSALLSHPFATRQQ